MKRTNLSNKNGNIEILRFVFSLLVLLFHINNRVNIKTPEHFTFFGNGFIGVEFFFIVAGYLLAASAQRRADCDIVKETVNCMYKKFNKIFPVHFFVLGFTILVYIYSNREKGIYDILTNVFGFLPNALLIQFSGIKSLHSVPLEWFLSSMFIAIPILYPLLLKFKKVFSVLVCPILSLTLIASLYINSPGIRYSNTPALGGLFIQGTIRAMAEIALGIFLFEVAKQINMAEEAKWHRILLTVTELFSYCVVIVYSVGETNNIFDGYMIFFFALGIVITFSKKSYFANLFDNKISYYLGSLGLPIYILQVIPLTLLEKGLLDGLRLRYQIVAVIVLTLIIAAVMNPIFNTISKKLDKSIKALYPNKNN